MLRKNKVRCTYTNNYIGLAVRGRRGCLQGPVRLQEGGHPLDRRSHHPALQRQAPGGGVEKAREVGEGGRRQAGRDRAPEARGRGQEGRRPRA
jgi:hypothetical protein